MERDTGDKMDDTGPKLERGPEVHFYHYPPAVQCPDKCGMPKGDTPNYRPPQIRLFCRRRGLLWPPRIAQRRFQAQPARGPPHPGVVSERPASPDARAESFQFFVGDHGIDPLDPGNARGSGVVTWQAQNVRREGEMERDARDNMADTEPKLERGPEVHFYHYPPALPCPDCGGGGSIVLLVSARPCGTCEGGGEGLAGAAARAHAGTRFAGNSKPETRNTK
jgi:rubredoxin